MTWIVDGNKMGQVFKREHSDTFQSGDDSDINYEGTDNLTIKNELLLELGITKSIFKQLLFAFMSSITGKTKVYISLNVELDNYSNIAMRLIELLYHYLPYSYRRKLAAINVSCEPEGITFDHVMFVAPGTLNDSDPSMELHSIFDFSKQKFSGVELEGQHEYLDFAWERLSACEVPDDFFEFAERALLGLPESEKLEIVNYYQLTTIYQTLGGVGDYYVNNKIAFLNSLLSFIKMEKAAKEDLEKLFLQILIKEKAAEDIKLATDFVKAVLKFNQTSLHDKGLAFILHTLDLYKNDPIFHKLWKIVEESTETYEPLMEFINLHPDYTQLLDTYLNEKFNLNTVDAILNMINKLLLAAPFLLNNRSFQSLAIKKTAFAVGESSDLFKAASAVKAFRVTNQKVDFVKLKEKMMVYSEITLLDELDLQTMKLTDIDTFAFLSTGKLDTMELKDRRIINKYKMLGILHELFNTPAVSVGVLLQPLSPTIRDELREVLKNVLRSNLSEDYFQHILAAFDDGDGSYHYPQLVAYLSKNADDTLMLSFIKWTAKNLHLDHHYHRALKNYLKSHPRSIWKDKTARKELQMISNDSFRKLVKEVQTESAGLFTKFFKKKGIHLSIALLIALAVGSGLYFGYDLLVDKKDHTAVTKASNSTAAEPAETNKNDATFGPFEKWMGEHPFFFNVNGEQQKLTFGQENSTGGKRLVLTSSQNIETPFDLVIDSEVSPFDENGLLKEGFSLYHTEYDFDANGNLEIVIMAISQTYESFVWVLSPITENGSVGLRTDLAIKGMSDAKLVDNTLKLIGDQGQSETYAYLNQQFVKQ